MSSPQPEISVVIPSWNTVDLLRTCLQKLEAAAKPSTDVIVVENGSEDGSGEMVASEFPNVQLIVNEQNEGFAKGCNQGMRAATGRYVLLLNTDTEVAVDAIEKLYDFLEANPEYGATAPRLIHPDGGTQRTCQAFPNLATALFFATPFERWFPKSRELQRYFMRDWDQEDERDIDQPPAACMLIRSSVLERIGLFDEELWLFFNDVDLSLRMSKDGWKTRYLADALVVHHVGASTSKFGTFVPEYQKNRLHYYRKHHGRLAGLFLKGCVGFALMDFLAQQLGRRLRGQGAEPTGPMVRAYGTFLKL